MILLDRLAELLRPYRRVLAAGAWFFIVVSLGGLAWVIASKWNEPAGATKLYHTVVDGRSYDAWGLTYTGTLGLLMAIVQAAAVSAAAVASVLPMQRCLRLRRIGQGVLCLWSALWALNLVGLATFDHEWDTIAQAALLGFLFLCTTGRAIVSWSPRR